MENTILYENGDEMIVDERITYLAKELGVDEEDIKQGYSDDVFEVTVDDEDREYLVVDEDKADEMAKDSIYKFIDELGIGGFNEWFRDWIINNAIDEDFLDDALQEEKEYFESEDEEENAEYVENVIDGDIDGKVAYFKEMWGDKEFGEWITEHDALDKDAIVEKVIDLDGRGQQLASYDFEEIELADDNGYIQYYAYRTN